MKKQLVIAALIGLASATAFVQTASAQDTTTAKRAAPADPASPGIAMTASDSLANRKHHTHKHHLRKHHAAVAASGPISASTPKP